MCLVKPKIQCKFSVYSCLRDNGEGNCSHSISADVDFCLSLIFSWLNPQIWRLRMGLARRTIFYGTSFWYWKRPITKTCYLYSMQRRATGFWSSYGTDFDSDSSRVFGMRLAMKLFSLQDLFACIAAVAAWWKNEKLKALETTKSSVFARD